MARLDVVEIWGRSLRDGDWEAARSLLADDATYKGAEDLDADFKCENTDQIVGLMRFWKGKLPDIEVVERETIGDSVVARLRQPAWGDDVDWCPRLVLRHGRWSARGRRRAALALARPASFWRSCE